MKFSGFTSLPSPAGTVSIVGYSGADNVRMTLAALPISTLTQTALNDREPLTLYRDANFTATVGRSYNVNDTDAGITVTNPTSPAPAEGDFFAVFVQGGSVTVGGTAYTDGAKIEMHYVGGGWERSVFYPAGSAFGTAAFRDVGQAAGNVLELSGVGQATIGSGSNWGNLILAGDAGNVGIRNDDGTLTLTTNTGEVVIFGNGTVALLTDITAAAVGLAAPGTTGNVLTSNGTAWTSETNAPAIGNVTGTGTGVTAALALNVNETGGVVLAGGTSTLNINGTVGATTAASGAFTTGTFSNIVSLANGSNAAPSLRFGTDSTGWFRNASGQWTFTQNGANPCISIITSLLRLGIPIGFTNGNSTSPADAHLSRISAGVLGVGAASAGGVDGALSLNEIRLSKTITAAATTGARTINNSTGSVNFAAAATSLVVTNSLVTVNSVIQVTVATNDTTMRSATAVAAAGSFTIFAGAAPTAETRVNFTLTN